MKLQVEKKPFHKNLKNRKKTHSSCLKVAVVGYGYWGPNLVRNFSELEKVKVVACCDLRKNRLLLAKKRYPHIKTTRQFKDILSDKEIDVIVIATPLSSHYSLAKRALSANKHVWVEKPMTETSLQAEKLITLARKKKKIIHVDHVFLYTEAVRTMKKIIDAGELGKIYYFDSVRINLGLFQSDANVIYDLAPHDISIMSYLLGKDPKEVSAFATSHIISGLEDTANLSFRFTKALSAHIHLSWLSPVKIRRTLIAGSRKMIIYDDLETSEKIKIYDYGVSVQKIYKPESSTSGYQYRTGDIYSPALENKEALRSECAHFIKCIRTNKKSLTDGVEGLKVIRVLESALRSLKKKGKSEKITF